MSMAFLKLEVLPVTARHGHGHVANPDGAELAGEGAAVGVTVQDEIGSVRPDRRREARRGGEGAPPHVSIRREPPRRGAGR